MQGYFITFNISFATMPGIYIGGSGALANSTSSNTTGQFFPRGYS